MDEKSVELLREIINKAMGGLPVHDVNGSKNFDKMVLLNKAGFKYNYEEKTFQRGDVVLTLTEIGFSIFPKIVDIALDK